MVGHQCVSLRRGVRFDRPGVDAERQDDRPERDEGERPREAVEHRGVAMSGRTRAPRPAGRTTVTACGSGGSVPPRRGSRPGCRSRRWAAVTRRPVVVLGVLACARSRRGRGSRGSPRSCTRAAATGSPTRGCGRPTGRRRRSLLACGETTTLTMKTRTDTAMMNAADRRHQVQGAPAHARRRRCRCGAACPSRPSEVHREEGQVEPDDHEPEVPLAEPLVEHPAEDLREPVVDAAEEPEDEAAEQHVVEVRDDEVGVGAAGCRRARRRVHHAGEPADGEHAR